LFGLGTLWCPDCVFVGLLLLYIYGCLLRIAVDRTLPVADWLRYGRLLLIRPLLLLDIVVAITFPLFLPVADGVDVDLCVDCGAIEYVPLVPCLVLCVVDAVAVPLFGFVTLLFDDWWLVSYRTLLLSVTVVLVRRAFYVTFSCYRIVVVVLPLLVTVVGWR